MKEERRLQVGDGDAEEAVLSILECRQKNPLRRCVIGV
jgi:hypothetical protein